MDLGKYMSKRDALGLLEINQLCLFCSSVEQFKSLFALLKNLLSFDCAVCGCPEIRSILLDPKIAPAYISFNYPQEFLETFFSAGYHLEDKVLQEFFETFELINWQKVMSKYDAESDPVDRQAVEFGLTDGFAYGVCDRDLVRATTFFLAGNRIENCARSRAILYYIIPHLSEALKRILPPAVPTPSNGPSLSPREMEVLKWLKEGKSSWDISRILSRSEDAVNFHVKNILRKLNAMNRTHAVAIALEKRLIEL